MWNVATCPLKKNILSCFEMVSRRERFQRIIIRRWSDNRLPSTIFFIYEILSCLFLPRCSARDNITYNSSLRDGQTLVSAGERFELGFFSPSDSSEAEGIRRSYVGIWYYKSNPRIFVWVANRENPLPSSNGAVLVVTEDGNLKLLDENGTAHWNTEVQSSSHLHRGAKLMDSGNFVLKDDGVGVSLWESFKIPTDTFLPGMYMGENLSLTSWISQDNPKPGNFTFKMDQGENRYQITSQYIPYWRSAGSKDVFGLDEIIPQILHFLSNISQSVDPAGKKSAHNNLNITSMKHSRVRLIMNFTGEIQYWTEDKVIVWSLIWLEPRDPCSMFHYCGNFGICNSNHTRKCQCLRGFVPAAPENWKSGVFSNGCSRKSALCVGNYTFLKLKITKVKADSTNSPATSETECLDRCRSSACQCQAYSYIESNSTRRDNPNNAGTCWIWTGELKDLQEDSSNGGHELYVRVGAPGVGISLTFRIIYGMCLVSSIIIANNTVTISKLS